MFSDVICYVRFGSPKEHTGMIEDLITYAGYSAAGTVNQAHLPFLIIVFNQFNRGTWETSEASSDFSTNERLRMYYRDVKVIYIYNVFNSPYNFYDQIYIFQKQHLTSTVSLSKSKNSKQR